MLYFPLLRAKKGELSALSTLHLSSRDVIRPILQIPPPDLDEKGNVVDPSSDYMAKVANTLQSVLAPVARLSCFLDPSPAGLSHALLRDLLFAIATYGGTPNPVYGLSNSTSYAQLYHQLIGTPRVAILRVGLTEIGGSLTKAIKNAFINYQLTPDRTMLLLDAGDISAPNLPPLNFYESALIGSVSQAASLGLAGIILASCALPASTPNLTNWVPATFVRRELELFRNVKDGSGADLHFSDYATGNVITAPNANRQGSPKARYTLSSNYEILKGQKTGRTPFTMNEQFYKISQYLINHPEFPGRNFSWGDDFIFEASQPGTQPRGNLTTWVAVNTSHHLELVASMLPSM